MRYTLKQDAVVDAMIWTGDNVREMQDFLYPASPLTHGKDSLGVNVWVGASPYITTKLDFMKAGDALVRTQAGTDTEPARYRIHTPAEFEAHYAAAEESITP